MLSRKQLGRISPFVIKRLQDERLRAALRFLVPHTTFYERFFRKEGIDPWRIRRVEDWQKLGIPLVRKKEYMSAPKDFVVAPDKARAFGAYYQYHSQVSVLARATLLFKGVFGRSVLKEKMKEFFLPKMPLFSGGTEYGEPIPVFLTGEEKKSLNGVISLLVGELKGVLPERTTAMNLFPYGPHMAWHAAHRAFDVGADLNLCTAAGGAIPTGRLVKMAQVFQPNVFAGMTEYVRHRFFPECRREQVRLPRKVVFVHGATGLSDAERVLLRNEAGKVGIKEMTVINLFGASELKTTLLPECSQGAGFHHLNPLGAILRTVEMRSPQDWLFADKGQMVVWTISGAGTLLLGYVLGDVAERVEHGCGRCGLRVQRFLGVTRSRAVQEQLRISGIVEEKVKGTRVNLTRVREKVLEIAGVQECQIVVEKTKNLVIRYAAKKNLDKKIKKTVALEVSPELKKVPLDTLMDSKKYKFEQVVIQ